ncbi:MAG TPA: cytochrome c oxidase subunit 4, partial [Microbacteriaceae bacterium]|nr:cytochrome c oxidase subunit 4 [Microbacteriaceae bacterium]
ASIEDGDSELGHYSPWSWWPMVLAASLAITFLGIAAGLWIIFIGVPLVVVALVGWVYEYYRGNFAR